MEVTMEGLCVSIQNRLTSARTAISCERPRKPGQRQYTGRRRKAILQLFPTRKPIETAIDSIEVKTSQETRCKSKNNLKNNKLIAQQTLLKDLEQHLHHDLLPR